MMVTGKSVTFTLTQDHMVKPTFSEKQLVRFSSHKKKYGIIKKVESGNDSTTLTLISGYKPSPRSKLNNRTPFSKYKGRILKVSEFTT